MPDSWINLTPGLTLARDSPVMSDITKVVKY